MCAALNNGYPASQIRLEMRECVPCAEDSRRQRQQAVALQALQASQQVFAAADLVAAAFELLARSVGRVARFVPAARPAGLVLSAIERQVQNVRTQIRVQRAANDGVIASLRLAA